MTKFINAKINIGLQVVNRREDGYHDLQTVFYPVGVYAGTPENPIEFCDILEVVEIDRDGIECQFTGRKVDCPLEKNLVWRAANLFIDTCRERGVEIDGGYSIMLDKHLPDGAGMGGGSADAAFTLLALAESVKRKTEGRVTFSTEELCQMAVRLGADCPFFIINKPVYAEGVGERMEPLPLDLSGKWLVVIKPDVYISTKEAFAGITPHAAEFDLRTLAALPITEWRDRVHNDFEDSIFPKYPQLAEIKQALYDSGAEYASLTGSGSCLYGIYPSRDRAEQGLELFPKSATIQARYLLKL